ncbi:hypothetical protein [Marimonas lutisalis]|uniref:hypothetical protein n=1 Tax=Marimonas lutisalis TaxID=2545756 RepID=UPI0010F80489|nr:hypothetical protein [Marimonas lutisalis]
MFGFLRVLVIGFVVLSVVYFSVSLYSRSVRREKLEDQWDEDNPESDDSTARDAYVEQGMKEYDRSIRPKLILLVYVIPAILATILMVVIN